MIFLEIALFKCNIHSWLNSSCLIMFSNGKRKKICAINLIQFRFFNFPSHQQETTVETTSVALYMFYRGKIAFKVWHRSLSTNRISYRNQSSFICSRTWKWSQLSSKIMSVWGTQNLIKNGSEYRIINMEFSFCNEQYSYQIGYNHKSFMVYFQSTKSLSSLN